MSQKLYQGDLNRTSKKTRLCLLLATILCSLFAMDTIVLIAQQKNDQFQTRTDSYDLRDEGIKVPTQKVTLDRIALLSAVAAIDHNDVEGLSDVLHLGFYSRDSIMAEAELVDEDVSYYVNPHRTIWKAGANEFTWPTSIMKNHGIKPNGLHLRVLSIHNGNRTIYPAIVYANRTKQKVSAYRFVASPSMSMTLRAVVIDSVSDNIVFSGPPQFVEANRKFIFSWPCVDAQSRPLHEGAYILKLSGKYSDKFMQKHVVSTVYTFYHTPILTQ